MNNFNELEIGKCYTYGDDSLYKVVDKGTDWILVLSYSYNHHVATPWIYKDSEIKYDKLYEETDEWKTDIFNNLEYHDYDILKEN